MDVACSVSNLELERDAAHGSSALDALHQVSDESGDLVAQTLGRDDGHLLSDLLVGIEIESQPTQQQ